MFELWIGLVRFFNQGANGRFGISDSRSNSFVKYWIEETINHTRQGRNIKKFIATCKKIGTVFVYGNHDNYLGTFAVPTVGVGLRKKLFTSSPVDGLFAEHGHQSDEHNRDGETSGWGIAYAAFIDPGLRKYEEFARRLSGYELPRVAAIEKLYPRLERIGYAADQCVNSGYSALDRLIGTIRREFLDQVLFWKSVDLERKLSAFRDYYNVERVHSGIVGATPFEVGG